MKLIRLIVFLFPLWCPAQTTKYFVKFTDKNNSPYSISNPSDFLSILAITRRTRQGISIQQNDIPVNRNYIDSVESKGAIVFTRSKWFNGVTIEADSATLQAVLSLPFVQSSSPVNRIRSHAREEHEERNKFEVPLYNFKNTEPNIESVSYGQSYRQIHIMNGDVLHDSGYYGDNMIIALLDAGFYHVDVLSPFDSIRLNNRILDTWDFVANESSVYEDYDHGMEVLSTIAGNVPGHLVGTAPHASFLLLRTEDVFTEHRIEEYNWDAGAEFADSAGADVISTSLGYAENFTNPAENHTHAEMNGHTTVCAMAANIAFSKGMLVLASAGNSGGGAWQYIGTPADGDDVLAVGGVNLLGDYASFSSTGPSADGDIKPNVAAVGQTTTIVISDGSVTTGNGTSFACPVLAGSATCLWQAFPDKTNREIFNAIQQSGSQHNAPDSLLGYGIPDFLIAYMILRGSDLSITESDNLVSIYPNPFNDFLAMKFYSLTDQEIHVEVFDAIGKKIFETQSELGAKIFNTIPLPLTDLQKGIYFLRLTTENDSFVKKVVKY